MGEFPTCVCVLGIIVYYVQYIQYMYNMYACVRVCIVAVGCCNGTTAVSTGGWMNPRENAAA